MGSSRGPGARSLFLPRTQLLQLPLRLHVVCTIFSGSKLRYCNTWMFRCTTNVIQYLCARCMAALWEHLLLWVALFFNAIVHGGLDWQCYVCYFIITPFVVVQCAVASSAVRGCHDRGDALLCQQSWLRNVSCGVGFALQVTAKLLILLLVLALSTYIVHCLSIHSLRATMQRSM